MGEYEPNDSRKVTLEEGNVPGEPPRTGPREGEARRKASDPKDKKDPKQMPQPQQRAGQSQQQGSGQSQSQSSQDQDGSSLWGQDAPRMARPLTPGEPGNPDAQDMQSQPGGPLAGNQPQAIDNPTGAATLEHDQYEVNQPQNMHKQGSEQDERVREQASRQENHDRGFGYGADGDAEMRDAPDVSEDGANPSSGGPEAEQRGYGGMSEAEKKAYDQR